MGEDVREGVIAHAPDEKTRPQHLPTCHFQIHRSYSIAFNRLAVKYLAWAQVTMNPGGGPL